MEKLIAKHPNNPFMPGYLRAKRLSKEADAQVQRSIDRLKDLVERYAQK